MTTLWSWSSSADTAPDLFVGAAPTIDTAGSYGERYVWPSTTAVAYARKTIASPPSDFGFRAIYVTPTPSAVSNMIVAFADGSAVIQARVDLSTGDLIRIRDGSTQVGQGTVALAQGVEHRIEAFRSGSTLTVKAYRVSDNSLRDTVTGTVGTGTIGYVYMGNNAAISGTLGSFSFDEMVFTNTAAEVGALSSVLSATLAVSPSSASPPYTLTATFSASGGSGTYQYQITNWGDGTSSPAQASPIFTKAIPSGASAGVKTVTGLVTG